MDVEQILVDCEERMDKSIEYYRRELRGIRTGRATTALVDYVKVLYYGSPTELRELAAVSVPDPTLLLVKPFDPSSHNEIIKAIETADLGFNPMSDGNTIRISVPPPSTERRKQLAVQARKMGEDARVAVRAERREANRHIDHLVKEKNLSEDDGKVAKEEVEELTKAHIKKIDETCNKKVGEIEET
ncbi:MAG: ribosome recycling factor [Planctomycetota bacterium]